MSFNFSSRNLEEAVLEGKQLARLLKEEEQEEASTKKGASIGEKIEDEWQPKSNEVSNLVGKIFNYTIMFF